MRVYVCSKCGAEDSLSRLVVVEGWEGIAVSAGDDGKPIEETTGEREAEWDWAELQSYHCAECDQEATLEDAVVVRAEVECRDCGFAGVPTEHPSTCKGELLGEEPPEVHPAQVALEVPA